MEEIDERPEVGTFGSDRENWFVHHPDKEDNTMPKFTSALDSLFTGGADMPGEH